jgi:hypothetical protein
MHKNITDFWGVMLNISVDLKETTVCVFMLEHKC